MCLKSSLSVSNAFAFRKAILSRRTLSLSGLLGRLESHIVSWYVGRELGIWETANIALLKTVISGKREATSEVITPAANY